MLLSAETLVSLLTRAAPIKLYQYPKADGPLTLRRADGILNMLFESLWASVPRGLRGSRCEIESVACHDRRSQ